MATHHIGDEVDLDRVVVGPVAWPVVQATWSQLGWSWTEGTRRRGAGGLRVAYEGGWLEITGLPSHRLTRLAGFLAAAAGRPVAVRTDSARAAVVETGVEMSSETLLDVVTPDGVRQRQIKLVPEGDTFDAEGGVPDAAMWSLAAGLWADTHLPEALVLPDSADTEPRDGFVRPAEADPAVTTGPSAILRAGDATLTAGPDERSRLEDALEGSGVLDADTKMPDLSRWAERAARRVGLAAAPAPGEPKYAEWHTTWLQLSAETRATGGRRGAVARWKVREPGVWPLTPDEAQRIAVTPGVPESIAAFVKANPGCGLEIVPG